MALAVVARTRYLQDELALNLKKQNELTANQTKYLKLLLLKELKNLAKNMKNLIKSIRLSQNRLTMLKLYKMVSFQETIELKVDLNLSTVFGSREIKLVVTYGGFLRQG